jgi:hypothetical protein
MSIFLSAATKVFAYGAVWFRFGRPIFRHRNRNNHAAIWIFQLTLALEIG